MGKTRKDRRTKVTQSCGKWRYAKRWHAERTRKRLSSTQGEVFFVYGCVECGGFHLTSQARYR